MTTSITATATLWQTSTQTATTNKIFFKATMAMTAIKRAATIISTTMIFKTMIIMRLVAARTTKKAIKITTMVILMIFINLTTTGQKFLC